MVVQLHGFDWDVYEERVMPAFSQWLLDSDERAIKELYEQTRCAYEEQFLPAAMQRLRVWPRAQAFLQTLPRGPYSRREYQKLCSPQQYTAMSDRYLYKHTPQLYQHSNALRSIWGSIIESFCLPWTPDSSRFKTPQRAGIALQAETHIGSSESVARGEIVSLLVKAGLDELAREVETSTAAIEQHRRDSAELSIDEEQNRKDTAIEKGFEAAGELALPHEEESDTEIVVAAQGVLIGQQSNLLHLRGWLASVSVRAMALFEFLACGRRTMPFGFEAGEPFGSFGGYITPDEVWQLASSLEGIVPPDQESAEDDFLSFRYQSYNIPPAFRMIDEVLPRYAADLLYAVQQAAEQGHGLISSVE